jgi:hypothetical protein
MARAKFRFSIYRISLSLYTSRMLYEQLRGPIIGTVAATPPGLLLAEAPVVVVVVGGCAYDGEEFEYDAGVHPASAATSFTVLVVLIIVNNWNFTAAAATPRRSS